MSFAIKMTFFPKKSLIKQDCQVLPGPALPLTSKSLLCERFKCVYKIRKTLVLNVPQTCQMSCYFVHASLKYFD